MHSRSFWNDCVIVLNYEGLKTWMDRFKKIPKNEECYHMFQHKQLFKADWKNFLPGKFLNYPIPKIITRITADNTSICFKKSLFSPNIFLLEISKASTLSLILSDYHLCAAKPTSLGRWIEQLDGIWLISFPRKSIPFWLPHRNAEAGTANQQWRRTWQLLTAMAKSYAPTGT